MAATAEPLLTTQYTLTPEEATRARSAAERASLRAENSPLKYWLIMAAATVLLGFRFYDQIIRTGDYLWVGIFLVAWVVIYLYIRNLSRARKSAAMEPVTLEVRPDGLIFVTRQQREHLRWTAFKRTAETDEFFLLQQAAIWRFVPKRAFSVEQQAWFGQLIREQTAYAALASSHVTAQQPQHHDLPDVSSAKVSFKLPYTLSDCLSIASASWITRGLILLLVLASLVGVAIAVFEDATAAKPIAIGRSVAIVLIVPAAGSVIVLASWTARLRWAVRKQSGISVHLFDQRILSSGPNGTEFIAWQSYDRFKETKRHFFVWKTLSRAYLVIPKRALAAPAQVDWLRAVLERTLQRSSWFFGL
jgi:hypothetical protein